MTMVGPVASTAKNAAAAEGVISVAQVEEQLIARGMSPATAAGIARSFEGPIAARTVEAGEQFFRFTGRSGTTGNFLTTTNFSTPAEAIEGLNLAPFGNPAGVRQIVVANGRSLVFEGQVAGGSAGQTLILDKGAFRFGLGVKF